MRSWGFTSMGNWCDPEIMAASRTPYVDNFNLDGTRKIEGDKHGMWRKFPDVFAPDFASNLVQRALTTRTPKSRTDTFPRRLVPRLVPSTSRRSSANSTLARWTVARCMRGLSRAVT